VARMEGDRLPLLAFQYHPSGHHDMGRPKRSWKDLSILKINRNRVFVNLNLNSSWRWRKGGGGVGVWEGQKPSYFDMWRSCGVVLTDWVVWGSVSQPPGRGPVPDPGINYTGPREVLVEFALFNFLITFHE